MTLHRTRKQSIYTAIKELSEKGKGYPLSGLCRLGNVSRAAYYKWLNHNDSENDALNNRIADLTENIHAEHPDMGYRRIRDTLEHDHISVDKRRDVVHWSRPVQGVHRYQVAKHFGMQFP